MILAVSLVVAQTLLTCAKDEPHTPGWSAEREAFVRALGAFRLTEGRLTGVPHTTTTRSGHGRRASSSLTRAARRIEQRVAPNDPAHLADVALVRLAAGHTDEAESLLIRAASVGPTPSWILSDLAAARYQRFQETARAYELVQALTAVEEAAGEGHPSPELAFNRALVLESLGLRRQATAAWEEYLASDRRSAWAAEAQHHLALLRRPTHVHSWEAQRGLLERSAESLQPARRRALVVANRQFVRLWLQDEVFPAWARAASGGDGAEAERLLRLLRLVADDLAAASGDPLLRDATRAAESATGSARADLLRAHLGYAEGRTAYEASDIRKARTAMTEARLLFARTGSPFEAWAAFHIAACDYYLRRGAAQVLEQSTALRARAHAAGYAVVEARTDWIDGAILLDQGRASEALARFPRRRFTLRRDRCSSTTERGLRRC